MARTSTAVIYPVAYARDNRWSLPSEPSITGMANNGEIGQMSTSANAGQFLTYWTTAGN